MTEQQDAGLPYCPNCGAPSVSAQRPVEGEAFDFRCINARCASCDGTMRIQLRPIGVHLIDDAGDETDVPFVHPEEGGLTWAAVSQWRRLPQRFRWLVFTYVLALFAPYLLSDTSGDEPWIFWTFAIHYSLASLLGLWAAVGRRFAVERTILAVLAAFVMGVIVYWCLGEDLEEASFWFPPATLAALATFAMLGRFGWHLRRLPDPEQTSDAASIQFSVAQLMIVTAAVGAALVGIQQLKRAFEQSAGPDHWGPIGMGLITAPAILVSVWAVLGPGRLIIKALLALLATQLLAIVALYVVDEWQRQAIIIVSIWSFVYVVFVCLPLLMLRSTGYRFIRQAKAMAKGQSALPARRE